MNKYLYLILLAAVPINALAENNFAGPYLGVNLGYVDGTDKGKEVLPNGLPNGYTQKTSPDGFLLGLNAGFNKVFENNVLLGVEGDYETRNADDKVFQKLNGVKEPHSVTKTSLENAASLRARLGYVFNDNRTMAYLTGGYATAQVKREFSNDGVTGTLGSESHTRWHEGWTAGFGVEHFVYANLSARAEYRYSDYNKKSIGIALYSNNERQNYDEEHAIRVGINYHF